LTLHGAASPLTGVMHRSLQPASLAVQQVLGPAAWTRFVVRVGVMALARQVVRVEPLHRERAAHKVFVSKLMRARRKWTRATWQRVMLPPRGRVLQTDRLLQMPMFLRAIRLRACGLLGVVRRIRQTAAGRLAAGKAVPMAKAVPMVKAVPEHDSDCPATTWRYCAPSCIRCGYRQ
jgi:hypothetical protein